MNKQQAQSDKSLTSNSAASGSVYIFKAHAGLINVFQSQIYLC